MPTTRIYTLSLHDALPISFEEDTKGSLTPGKIADFVVLSDDIMRKHDEVDRKSTRLNSSHVAISYAVFCLKKKIFTIQSTLHLVVDTNSEALVSLGPLLRC